jgi:hypothetical protein
MTHSFVKASYTPHKIARMAGNPLIEALPPELSDDELAQALWLSPDFDPEQRTWENHFRLQQIKGLSNFMVPLTRHMELARMLDVMMREGYVARPPKSKAFVEKLCSAYEMQKAGQTYSQTHGHIASSDSAALIGPSGLGKTTTVRRHLARYPQVIHHEELNITQITYLHVDISSDGASVKALAIGILTAIDKLLPDHDYHRLYLQTPSRSSTESLIYTVSRLLTIHHVGLLIADEVQNLCNSKKGAQTVMTELVTMCNVLSVPILFIGTNKAVQVLTADFRQARRSTGVGIQPWSKLPRYDYDVEELAADPEALMDASEWGQFIEIMWEYQWVRNPTPLSHEILDVLYQHTQGILDLAIKLFATAQARAILTGAETLSVELLHQVYEQDFKLMHESVEALATNDYAALARYADVAPTNLNEILTGIMTKASRRRIGSQLTRRGAPGFQQQVAVAAMASGVDEEHAETLAREIDAEGIAQDSGEALTQLAKKLRPAPLRTPSKFADNSKPIEWPDLTDRSDDYRHALKAAQDTGATVFAQLQKLGMAQDAEAWIPIG